VRIKRIRPPLVQRLLYGGSRHGRISCLGVGPGMRNVGGMLAVLKGWVVKGWVLSKVTPMNMG
jgi:hypothetical protein